jgi:diacylglycerol kinase (ATP)
LATQPNARIHALATVVVSMVAWLKGLSAFEWCWLVIAITVVWMAEALNTAVEFLGDAIHDGPDPLIGRAKDVAAGGVLLAASGAACIGIIIFAPHVLK